MKKKCILSILLTAALLTGCAQTHTHTAGQWRGDPKDHWQLCADCGEEMNKAPHTVADELCSTCGAQIYFYEEEGTTEIALSNDRGDWIYSALYDAEGAVLQDSRAEYTYDAEGNRLTYYGYTNGVLDAEVIYSFTPDGQHFAISEIYTSADGARQVSRYDELGNPTEMLTYTPDGSLEYGSYIEYNEDHTQYVETYYEGETLLSEYTNAIDPDGWTTTLRAVNYDYDGACTVYEYDLHGNETLEAYYDAAGVLTSETRYENEYDAEGNRTLCRTYTDGRLSMETEYISGDDWTQSGKTTTYYEDGSYCIEDYAEDLTSWSSSTTYAADGTVTDAWFYEYIYDTEGESIGSLTYHNGKLEQKVEAVDMGDTRLLWTYYEDDGSTIVQEYGEEFNFIRETVYDAAGNILSQS